LHAQHNTVMAIPPVCPMPVLCLNAQTYRHIYLTAW